MLINFTKLLHPNTVIRVLYLDQSKHVKGFWKVPKNGKILLDGTIHTIDEHSPILKSGKYNLYVFSYSHIKAIDFSDQEIAEKWNGIIKDFITLREVHESDPEISKKLFEKLTGELELLKARNDQFALDPYAFPRESTSPEDIQTILESAWLRDIVQAVKSGFGKKQLIMIVGVIAIIGLAGYFVYQKIANLETKINEIYDMLTTIIGG